MTKYPAPTMYAPTLSEYYQIAGLIALDFVDGVTEDPIRQRLIESGWRGPDQEIPQTEALLRYAKEDDAIKRAKELVTQAAHQAVIGISRLRTGKEFSVSGDVECSMLDFERFRIRQLPWQDLMKVQTDIGSLLEKTKKADNGPRDQKYKEYQGISFALVESIKNIYFTYPETKFAELAQLFHKYDVDLSVRPKSQPGKDTKAALGLSGDQGGVTAKLTIEIPKDRWKAIHILLQIPDEEIFSGDIATINNTKVAMSALLIHGYKQKEPLGPQWELGQKEEMYEKYGLAELLIPASE